MNFRNALLVLGLAIFAIAPLEYPGIFQSQTGLSAVYNLINLDQNPLQFFNWAPTFGETFDLFRTEGALPYWVALIFHRIGFSYLNSIKFVCALAWIASGCTMFAFSKKYFSDAGALLAATVYVYLPLHIATIYLRGAFAESVAWAIFPLALQSITNYPAPFTKKTFAFSLLPFALLFLTQPGIAILFSLFAIALDAAIRWRNQNFHLSSFILHPFLGLALGALLTLPVWTRYGARLAADEFKPDFVLPYQLFASLWATGDSSVSSAPSQGNFLPAQLSLQLGLVAIGLTIVTFALKRTRETKIFFMAAIVVTLLTFPIAAPAWSILGIFAAYPGQLLGFAGLMLALCTGSIMDAEPRWQQSSWVAFFIALPIIASYGYLAPRYADFSPSRPEIAMYGDIALLDYRIVGPLRHGATVRIEVKWQALRQMDRDYSVFVRAVHTDSKTYAQADEMPLDGASPTSKWKLGEIILDTHTVQINVDGPREGFHLELGLFDAATGARLKMQNGADVLILPRPGDPPPTISDNLPAGK